MSSQQRNEQLEYAVEVVDRYFSAIERLRKAESTISGVINYICLSHTPKDLSDYLDAFDKAVLALISQYPSQGYEEWLPATKEHTAGPRWLNSVEILRSHFAKINQRQQE